MEAATDAQFKKNYQAHLQHLKLKGPRPKTIEAYSRAIRRIGERFDHQIDHLEHSHRSWWCYARRWSRIVT